MQRSGLMVSQTRSLTPTELADGTCARIVVPAAVRWPVGLDINYTGAESNLAHQAEEPIHHQPAGTAAYAAPATHRVVRRYPQE